MARFGRHFQTRLLSRCLQVRNIVDRSSNLFGLLLQLILRALLLDGGRNFRLDLVKTGGVRLFLVHQHGNRESTFDAGAVADIVRVIQRSNSRLKLLAAADARHVVARRDERRLFDHLRRFHVRLRGQLLRNFLRVFCFLQKVLGALRDLGGGGITPAIAQRSQQFRLGLGKSFRH